MNGEQIKRLMQLYGLQLVKTPVSGGRPYLCGHGLFWQSRFSCWNPDPSIEYNIPTAFDCSAEPVQSWVEAGCPEPKIGN